MDYSREHTNRGNHPGENESGEMGRKMPMSGFEGMNYEQRRAPYKPRRQDVANNRNSEQESSRGSGQEDKA